MVSNQIINEVILRDKGFEKTNKKFAALRKNINGVARSNAGFGKIQSTMGSINMQIDNQNKKIKQSILNTTKLGRAWEQSKMGVMGFNGALLSTLFFGMELKRIFGGALKSIFEGYNKIMGEGSAYNKQMTKLTAAWQFFKFQLADALASTKIFQIMIQGAVNLLNWFGQLPKPIRAVISSLLVVGAIIGSLMFLTGIWGLGIAGIVDGFAAMGVTAAGTKAKMLGFFKFAGIFAAIATALGLAKKQMDAFYNSSVLGQEAQENLKKGWKDTINSALNPMSQALSGVGIELKTMTEFNIAAGVVWHNFMTILGMFADVIIALARTIGNFIQLSVKPLIEVVSTAADALFNFFKGDFSGARDAVMGFKSIKDNLMGDIKDIGDSWETAWDNIDFKRTNLQGIRPALEEYRKQLDSVNQKEQARQDVIDRFGQDNVTFAGAQSSIDGAVNTQRQQNIARQNVTEQTTINIGEETIYGDTGNVKEEILRLMQESGLNVSIGDRSGVTN